MADSAVVIHEVTALTTDVAAALLSLLPQLSSSATLDDTMLQTVVETPASALLIARVDDAIVGMCTLATLCLPTGVRCWIEDVVVDEAARGHGVGSLLVEQAIAIARSKGARSVDLTSRPARAAANRLYRRLGFALRETNVYRFSLEN